MKDKEQITVCIIRSNPVRPDSRVEKEAWALFKAGYRVHILAWDRDTNDYEAEDVVCVGEHEIPITRLGHKATYGEGLKSLKAYLAFQFHQRKWLARHNFHIVHACDFDTAFFSQGIAKRKKAKFIFDIFDFLYGEPKNFIQKFVKALQFRIIDHADATIICTEERKKQIQGSHPNKLIVIHNTPSLDQMKSHDAESDTLWEIDTDKINIVYVGILQDYRLLKEIAEVVKENQQLKWHVAGFGKYENYFRELSTVYSNIKFYGKLSYEETLELEKNCDIMLAIYDPEIENHRFAAPNKFYESLMLGKPVIMVENTGMSMVVREEDIGALIQYSKEGFREGLDRLILRKKDWLQMSKHMQTIYKDRYNWGEMEERLLSLYRNL